MQTVTENEVWLDCETDGLKPSVIWCVAANGTLYRDATSFKEFLYSHKGAKVYAHNGIGADFRWLEDLWGVSWSNFTKRDTLVLSRLANPSREGGHSLDNLSGIKGEYSDWSQYTDEMGEYCLQDERALRAVGKMLQKELEGFSEESIELEHQVAEIIHRQVQHGWLLDTMNASMLLADLRDKLYAIEEAVQETFKPCAVPVREIEPQITKSGRISKVGLKSLSNDYENVGGPLTLIKWQEFNPGSRKQIGERLVKLGWEPRGYTPTGQPIVDEGALETASDIPEARLIAEFLMVQKRVAMVSSWLEAQDPETERVHGYVNTNGAVTGRMTHSKPNLAQVPASYSPYGKACRGVWVASQGRVLVGCDASQLELRCLAHYMKDEKYKQEILEGDIHTANMKAAGLIDRDRAKTLIYALTYGAGDAKLGTIVGGSKQEGARLRKKFLEGTPALKRLIAQVGRAYQRGYLKGLDGRKLWVRSEHSALNTLLQSMGAVIMKKALVNLVDSASHLDYNILGNIHDEWQLEARPEQADELGQLAVEAIRKTEHDFNLFCPMDGEYKIGDSWAETH